MIHNINYWSIWNRKTNVILNLISLKPDIDKTYLHTKCPYEVKYQFLINKRGSVGLRYFGDLKTFMQCSNDMDDIYKNVEEYNPNKNDDMTNYMLRNLFV